MKTLFKIVMVTAPVMALVLWYVVSQQHSHRLNMDRDAAQFDKIFYREELSFAQSKEEREEILADKKEAEQRLMAIKAEQAKAKSDDEEFRKEFKDALTEEDEREAKNKKDKKR